MNDSGIAGAFEELPVLLVVLVAISLFSVSVAHAASAWNDSQDFVGLQDDCDSFARMVRGSETLCNDGKPGIFDSNSLQNFSEPALLEEFNRSQLGFEYRITVNCIDPATGNITLSAEAATSAMPSGGRIACTHTCVNVDIGGTMGAARVTVSIWQVAP